MSKHGLKRDMSYVWLGKSRLKISRIVLGLMTYGTPKWQKWVLGKEEGLAHVKAAFDAGIKAFDTANVYSDGHSEEILGKAIKQYNLPRDEIVVLTKACFPVGEKPGVWNVSKDPDAVGFVNQHGLSRKLLLHIFDSVKHFLRRLGLDYIDVLQCHRFDHDTPIEEIMQGLHDVIQAGYVRYIGTSSCYAYHFVLERGTDNTFIVAQMQNYTITNKLTPLISMQNHYNSVYREEEREMMLTLRYFGVGSIPWHALARGAVTRSWKVTSQRSANDPYSGVFSAGQFTEQIVNASVQAAFHSTLSSKYFTLSVQKVAELRNISMVENLEELITTAHMKLTDEVIKSLEEPYKAQAISGHDS